MRNKRKDALKKCVFFCKEDIKILPRFLEQQRRAYEAVPHCPSVIQLAIIYEKNKEYQRAIDICNYAIEQGLDDGTKMGFQGRRERLKKKLNK